MGFGALSTKVEKIEANVNYLLRKEAFRTLQRLPFSYYDKTPQGWIMARMTSDSKRLANIISWGIVDVIWSLLLMIFTLTILYFLLLEISNYCDTCNTNDVLGYIAF